MFSIRYLKNKQNEKKKNFLLIFCCCLVAKSCLTLLRPMDCSLPAPLSMKFSRQESWSRLLFPSPGNLLNPGIFYPEPPGKHPNNIERSKYMYRLIHIHLPMEQSHKGIIK